MFVAPARYVLTRLHRRDPDGASDLAAADPVEGRTVCGLPLLASELWLPVEARDGEVPCAGCMVPGSASAEPDEDGGVLF